MKIVEFPEGLSKKERLDFLSKKKKQKKVKKIDKTQLVGEPDYFLIYKNDGVISIESREYKKYSDFSDIEKDDLVEAFDLVKIINRNNIIKFYVIKDIDFYKCIIK